MEARPDVTGKLSVVIPVRNEADGIRTMLDSLRDAFDVPVEILIIYDDDSDTTLPVVRSIIPPPGTDYRLIQNTLGRGPANALKAGFAAARGEALIVIMADQSDDLRALKPMLTLFDQGCDLVAGSRYMKGGEQIGGPWLKGKLSRLAGVSLNLEGDATVWEQEPMRGLARDGQLASFRHDGFWQPMDTLRDRNQLEHLWSSGQAPWHMWA